MKIMNKAYILEKKNITLTRDFIFEFILFDCCREKLRSYLEYCLSVSNIQKFFKYCSSSSNGSLPFNSKQLNTLHFHSLLFVALAI